MLLFGAASVDLVLAWAICRMVGQGHAYKSLEAPPVEVAPQWPRVAVIVPARDEADVIARCLSGLLAQDYPPERMSIILVDDGSRDGTARIADETAGADPRFRLVPGRPLPDDWTGKSHACAQGAVAAGEPDYLCFVDADTAARPSLIRSAVSHALRNHTDMLSLEPFQELGSLAERLVFPCGLYLVAATQDVAAVNAPGRPEANANGQFILFARTAYASVGGHAAVSSEVCEDMALAQIVKRSGLRFELLGAEQSVSTRMYRNARDLWHGLSKNASALGGGPVRTVAIAAAGLTVAAALPLLAGAAAWRVASGYRAASDSAALALALCGLLAAVGLHVAGARHFKIPVIYGLLFPLGYGLALAIAVNAARLKRRGRIRWKDREFGTTERTGP